ncbi:hypothetical protein OA90_27560 [Labrenzia sp. OB1]|nr:hypothetical protein OA90_27560 [Labrenzia sp. OB1]
MFRDVVISGVRVLLNILLLIFYIFNFDCVISNFFKFNRNGSCLVRNTSFSTMLLRCVDKSLKSLVELFEITAIA